MTSSGTQEILTQTSKYTNRFLLFCCEIKMMPRPVMKDVVDQVEWEPAMAYLCFYDSHFKVQHFKAANHLIWQTEALFPDLFWGDRIFI